jgi:hypothetical protein
MQMQNTHPARHDPSLAAVDAITLASLLEEHRAGNDPIVATDTAALCLRALGRPLTPSQTRDLIVMTWTLGGRNVAPLSRYIAAADEFIARRADLPNLKQRGVAKARAAKRGRTHAVA